MSYGELEQEGNRRRPALMGTFLLAGVVSILVGAPGRGKTLLAIMYAVCVAVGRAVAGDTPDGAHPVMLVSVEDDAAEISRRVQAAVIAAGGSAGLMHRNFHAVTTNSPLVLASRNANGIVQLTAKAKNLFRKAKRLGVKLLVIDPWVEVNGVAENSNDDIHAVVSLLRSFAHWADCAVLIVHHSGKADGGQITMGSARGASSLSGAVRVIRGVEDLERNDTELLHLQPGEDQDYFKVKDVKNSYYQKRRHPIYFRRVSMMVRAEATPKLVAVEPEREEDAA